MKRTLSLVALLTLGALNLTLTPRVDAQVLPAPALMNFQRGLALPDGTAVADGDYSITFSLWDAETAGNQRWTQTLPAVAVVNGVFDVLLDVGTAGLFNGDLWMEIQIGTDVPLSPRQQLVSAAYAMKANTVPDGSIGAAQIAPGSIGAAQIAAASIPADKLAAGTLDPVAWLRAGNSGTLPGFLGTTDKQPLIFRTSNTEKMRIQYDGLVGIGTATPTARLDVNGDAKAASFIGSGAKLTALPPNAALLGANQAFSGVNTFSQTVTVNGAVRARGGVPGAAGANNNGFAFSGNGGDNDSGLFSSADGQLEFYGNAVERMRLSPAGNLGLGITPTAKLHLNGGIKVEGANTLEFGAGVAGKEMNSGKIGYRVFTPDALDIVGAGTSGPSRKIQFFAAGGATFTGPVGTTGNISAPSATIPTLNGNVSVNGELTAKVVTITGGSDVAEPYHVANAGDIQPIPGMVVAIDSEQIGQMRVASRSYDKTVAGILSGANGISPGITLRQAGTVADGTLPVASIGRVWCYCDADANGSIEAGDMLTTSDTPGHAMKVGDFDRANGSVIGKAMSPLKSGQGLVLVLVSLK